MMRFNLENSIVASKTFEEKMKDRIKESIGDLISNEDLSKIVERGIEDAFFKPVTVCSKWGEHHEDPPLIISVVKDILTTEIRDAVTKWFNENPDKVKNILDTAIRDGVVRMVLQAFDNKLNGSLINFGQQIQTIIQNNLRANI